MAHFYGTLKGNRGQATRLGTKNSGLTTVAASWEGAVRTELWQHENGRDYVTIELIPWRGVGTRRMLYRGPVSGDYQYQQYPPVVGSVNRKDP